MAGPMTGQANCRALSTGWLGFGSPHPGSLLSPGSPLGLSTLPGLGEGGGLFSRCTWSSQRTACPCSPSPRHPTAGPAIPHVPAAPQPQAEKRAALSQPLRPRCAGQGLGVEKPAGPTWDQGRGQCAGAWARMETTLSSRFGPRRDQPVLGRGWEQGSACVGGRYVAPARDGLRAVMGVKFAHPCPVLRTEVQSSPVGRRSPAPGLCPGQAEGPCPSQAAGYQGPKPSMHALLPTAPQRAACCRHRWPCAGGLQVQPHRALAAWCPRCLCPPLAPGLLPQDSPQGFATCWASAGRESLWVPESHQGPGELVRTRVLVTTWPPPSEATPTQDCPHSHRVRPGPPGPPPALHPLLSVRLSVTVCLPGVCFSENLDYLHPEHTWSEEGGGLPTGPTYSL